MASAEVLRTLMVMAEIAGRQFTSDAPVRLLAADLSEYPDELVLKALSRCRREVRGFPSIAEIIERIDDGRPGPEEAWALLPQSEDETCVWTDEMREAYGVSRALDNPVQARLAFVETYREAVAQSRAERRPVRWTASLGHDPQQRDRAIKRAIELKRLTQSQAAALIPEIPVPTQKLLEGPSEPPPNPQAVRAILAQVLGGKDMSENERQAEHDKQKQEVEKTREFLRHQSKIIGADR